MKKIYLVDWNNLIYRMFFALPEFSTKSWVMVNALFWVAKFFCNQLKKEKPDYLIFIKDSTWKNFRHDLYSDYKATRDKIPDNLKSQISLIEEMLSKMNIKTIQIPWYEADDIIASFVEKYWLDKQNEVFILSWDKDLFSLTSQNVKIYDLSKQKIYDDIETQKKFGILSKYIPDYLAIVWDNSDNIPWISWFWPKKAIDLINKYNTIENIYNHINDDDFIIWWKTLQKLKEQKDIAFLSKKLALLKKDLDLSSFDLKDFLFDFDKIYNKNLKKFFYDYEFFSLLSEDNDYSYKSYLQRINLNLKIIDDDLELEKLFKIIKKYKKIVIDILKTSDNIISAEIIWMSIFLDEDNIYYINFWHKNSSKKVSKLALSNFLKKLLSIDDLLIIWHDIKFNLEIIKKFLKSDFESQDVNIWQLNLFL